MPSNRKRSGSSDGFMVLPMPSLIIFSDLDGTLLDHDTYRWEEALPALERCRISGVPVVLVSSKTRAEMEPLRKKMGIEAPFVTENGGGIFFPPGLAEEPPAETVESNGLRKWRLGKDYAAVVKALKEIALELDLSVKGFSDMEPAEISRLTGLGVNESRLAAKREFDEPFIAPFLEPSDERKLQLAAARRGLSITSGGRFHHLFGHGGKGAAMEKLIRWYRTGSSGAVTAALGDSPNDFPMLELADHSFLVRSHRFFPELAHRIKGLKTTVKPGPAGWNIAVIQLLDKLQGEADESKL